MRRLSPRARAAASSVYDLPSRHGFSGMNTERISILRFYLRIKSENRSGEKLRSTSSAGRKTPSGWRRPGRRRLSSPHPHAPFYTIFRWRVLVPHEHDISRVAKLAWKLRHPSTTNAYEIDLFKFWFAYMPWVRRRLSAVLTHIRALKFNGIAQMSTLSRCFSTGLADLSILLHLIFLLFTGIIFDAAGVGQSKTIYRVTRHIIHSARKCQFAYRAWV